MAINVTVADDSKMSRKSIIKALPENWDMSLSEACNGKEALEKYNQGLADVMFLDLTMPEMDGFQVLEELHRIAAKCIVIVISADIQPTAQKRVNELGAASFIQKPMSPDQLQDVLHEVGLI